VVVQGGGGTGVRDNYVIFEGIPVRMGRKVVAPASGSLDKKDTVASLPKILQNNSKPAVKRRMLAGKIGGCTAAVCGQKLLNKFLNEKHVLMQEILHFLSCCQ
jgi:hypothetical protein